MPMYEQKFEIRYYEANKYKEATPATILTLLQETAASHCLSLGYGVYDLLEQNVGWVLLSGFFRMESYPEYKENITIKTWISQYSKSRVTRESLILNEQGDIIGSTQGKWIFFDINKQRPAKIFKDMLEQLKLTTQENAKKDIDGGVEIIETAKYQKDFIVSRFDVDTNEHLNNIRYFQWLMETIPNDIQKDCYLHLLEGRFIAGACYGDKIKVLTNPHAHKNSFIHTLKETCDNKVCLVAKTVWKSRK